MEERLQINQFGTLHEADIALRDLTVFVGPQTAGKSLTMQAFFFLHWMEGLFSPDTSAGSTSIIDATLSLFEWWLGNRLCYYTQPGTLLRWYPPADHPSGSAVQEIMWNSDGARLNDALHQRIRAFLQGGLTDERQRQLMDTQVYIPAGRTLYSFLPPTHSMRFVWHIKQQWPDYILTFYEALGAAMENLWMSQEHAELGFTRAEAEDDERASFLREKIGAILKGTIRYGPDRISMDMGDRILSAQSLAAGQMEVWPFWTIIEDRFLLKRCLQHVYFDEPETSLHPRAQLLLMEMVAFLVRQGVRFVITTHSPYTLYAINTFLAATRMQQREGTLPPRQACTALRPQQVAVYRFAADGLVQDIMDRNEGLIAQAAIQQIASSLEPPLSELAEGLL